MIQRLRHAVISSLIPSVRHIGASHFRSDRSIIEIAIHAARTRLEKGMAKKFFNSYILKMLFMVVAAPAFLILLGALLMSVVEPKPEYSGYRIEWSRFISFFIYEQTFGACDLVP